MKITKIKVREINKKNVIASASIDIDGSLIINGILLLNGRNGHFVSMPSEKWNDGSYHDITYFKGKKAQDYLKDQIEKAYEKIKGSASNDESNPFE